MRSVRARENASESGGKETGANQSSGGRKL
jgi:hypothetical protein